MTVNSERSSEARAVGPRLGELLLQRGLIGSQELKKALAQQQKIGGHLGTNLLENGAITEAKLLAALGEQRSAATVSAGELRGIAEEVLKLIPPRLARRHLIIPFRLSGRTLHLAAVAPESVLLVEDEIRMFTSCLVRTHIGLEFRVREAILRYYGGREDARMASLARRLSQTATGKEATDALVYRAGSSQPKAVERETLATQTQSPTALPTPTSTSTHQEAVGEAPAPKSETREEGGDAGAESHTDSLNVTVVLDRVPASSASGEQWRRPPATEPQDLRGPAGSGASSLLGAPRMDPPPDDVAAPRAAEAREGQKAASPRQPDDRHDPGTSTERVQFRAVSIEQRDRPEKALQPPERPEASHRLAEEEEEAGEADWRTQLVPAVGTETVAFQSTGAASESLGEATQPFEEPRPQLHSTDPDARLEEAALLLEHSEMRDDVGDTVLAFCEPFFRRCLLLARRRGEVVGWQFEGGEVSDRLFGRLRFTVQDKSVFGSLESDGTIHSGPLPKDPPLPQELLAALRQQIPRECVIVPIRVAGRVVCYLWADNIRGYLGRTPLAQMQRLGRKAGLALEICVLRNRIRTA